MKVGEMITELSKLDPEMPVLANGFMGAIFDAATPPEMTVVQARAVDSAEKAGYVLATAAHILDTSVCSIGDTDIPALLLDA